jgi:hypothetical protein
MTTPQTLSDLLTYLAPPLELLTYLDKVIAGQGDKVPPSIREYREKWRKLNAGEAFSEVDKFDRPMQAELLKGQTKYE